METIDCPRCERKPDMCNCTYNQLYASIYQMRAQLAAAKEEMERRKLKWQRDGSDVPDVNDWYWIKPLDDEIPVRRPQCMAGNNVNPSIHAWAGPIEPPEEKP